MREGAKARRGELRDSLLDAAERRVAAGGLQAVSVRQLAADTGCGAGTISYVFGSLNQLVLAVNERTLIEIAAAMDEKLERMRGETRARRMEALALTYLDYARCNRPRWEALFLHRMTPHTAIPDWYLARRAELIGRIAGVILDGKPDDATGGMLARTTFAAVHGVVLLGLDGKLGDPNDAELRERVVVLVGLLAAGLQPMPRG